MGSIVVTESISLDGGDRGARPAGRRGLQAGGRDVSVVETDLFTTDLGYPEGPVPLPDGSVVVTELAGARGCITQVSRDGTHSRIATTGRPNGLAIDADEALWVAESLDPTLLRVTLDGRVERVADRLAGEALLWPNDLCFGPDGALYLTDSGVLLSDFMDGDVLKPGWEEVPLDGKVFRIERNGAASVIDRGLAFVNGIAFGPDGLLYVAETRTGNVYRYSPADWQRDRFGNVLDPKWPGSGFRGPDGMAFDAQGLLYVSVLGQGDITVLGRNGDVLRRHALRGSAPTNCAFATDGSTSLFVAEGEQGTIERLDLRVGGLDLWR
jgi:gluconolactonase